MVRSQQLCDYDYGIRMGGTIYINYLALNQEYHKVKLDEEGYNLYKRNGFEELEEDMKIAKNDGEKTCIPMYLPLDLEE